MRHLVFSITFGPLACGDDGVEHPEAGGKGSREYCARAIPMSETAWPAAPNPVAASVPLRAAKLRFVSRA
jgi:hypothetical protein